MKEISSSAVGFCLAVTEFGTPFPVQDGRHVPYPPIVRPSAEDLQGHARILAVCYCFDATDYWNRTLFCLLPLRNLSRRLAHPSA